MKLIIGLGNPGKEFIRNRHNVGFMFIEFLERQEELQDTKLFKVENMFMNDSGRFIAEKVNFYKITPENLVIVHDDLDLKLGEFKINFGKGPQVHNGLLSIEDTLGTKDFWRVRVGTDTRANMEGKLGDSGHDFVLGDFNSEEMGKLENIFPMIYEKLRERSS